MTELTGYLRSDGRKGIRNRVAVAYLVECAHHVAREIAWPNRSDAHVIGFPGCFPNAYAQGMMERLCTHPNVGAVRLVSESALVSSRSTGDGARLIHIATARGASMSSAANPAGFCGRLPPKLGRDKSSWALISTCPAVRKHTHSNRFSTICGVASGMETALTTIKTGKTQ